MAAIFDALPPDFSAAVQVHAPRKRRFALRAQHTMIWCNECVFWERGALALANIHAHTLTLPLPLSLFLPFSLSPFRSHPFYLGEYIVRSCRLIAGRCTWTGRFQTVHPLFLSFYVSLYCALNAHYIASILCAQCPQYNEYIVRSMPLGMHMDRSLPDRSSASSPPEQLLLPPQQQRQLLPLAAAAAAAAAGRRRP